MKKSPAPRVAPAPLDFVLARVFDMYRELATRAPAARAAPPAPARREARKPRETVE